eukprot:SAG31_NODE_715_length_12634_cov_5.289190_9_plen_63_part_00
MASTAPALCHRRIRGCSVRAEQYIFGPDGAPGRRADALWNMQAWKRDQGLAAWRKQKHRLRV